MSPARRRGAVEGMPVAGRYDAVLFDLLTALLDSWSLWNAVAGDDATGSRWRGEYLRRTYAVGDYRPYEDLVSEAARAQRLDPVLARQLADRWDELAPWPEAPGVVAELTSTSRLRVGVVTNCSEDLGRRAAARLGVPLDVVVTAQAAGAYKPRPEPYRRALDELGLPPERVLFVAGSPYDIPGAGGVGMPVWWHNRARMTRGDLPAPLAEHHTLTPLLGDLSTPSAERPDGKETIPR
ncbi:HAD-IA family hydrolase [Embleya hyalina]|uniref:Putative HAD-superfamily hydrolase YfnB n=1 Tax=Embleya hyalina TaxID=516124 RepID=A0A401YET7_9ACTN|nr:HAD-IA family hydrolase [Embleya hyalina]GCD93099.1 putative HAD-superfamily hydrolase YfnB [Embleya hyalina]